MGLAQFTLESVVGVKKEDPVQTKYYYYYYYN